MMNRQEVMQSILKDHNHSWYEDIYMRNKDRKDAVAMLYRGSKYTYGDFFEMVIAYAKALKSYGIEKGTEFVACLEQTPDYPVLVAAASYIGAKINLVNANFDKEYLATIIEKANADVVLVADWDFARMSTSLHKTCKNKKIVTLPVSKWDKYNNPYKEVTDRFFKFNEEEYENCLKEFDNIVTVDEFLANGENYTGELNGHTTLEDELAITYTSGSTSKGVHKGVVQKNGAYITMGRYHDHEVAGIPKMDNTITLACVGPHADTALMSGVSDTLIQGGTIALDPIIDEHYFLYSLKFNNAGLAIATRTFWIRAMKETYENPEFKGLKLPGLYVPSEGGEPLSAGEEKALNRWLRDIDAGVAITHTPFSIVKMTIGGGDSEHGSLFLSLFRAYSNYLQKIRGINEPMGLSAYDFVDIVALREDGTYCAPMELGHLVANSPISMKGYHNNPEATAAYYIRDAYGNQWGDLSNYGYIDKWKKVYMKGRISKNDPKILPFQIADVILLDTKNIMSCEVIHANDAKDGELPTYVAHIETQYHKKVNIEKTLLSAQKRCEAKFGDQIKGKLLFRVRDHKEGFPTLFTAKRNLNALREEGITEKCIIPSESFQKGKDDMSLSKRRY